MAALCVSASVAQKCSEGTGMTKMVSRGTTDTLLHEESKIPSGKSTLLGLLCVVRSLH